MKTTHVLALCLFVWPTGCGDIGPPIPVPRPVVFDNQSQFELDELRVHRGPDYRGIANLLEAPLVPGSRTSTTLDGQYFVTVFRVRARGARTIALTTAQPFLMTDAAWFEVLVFDESFRLTPHSSGAAP